MISYLSVFYAHDIYSLCTITPTGWLLWFRHAYPCPRKPPERAGYWINMLSFLKGGDCDICEANFTEYFWQIHGKKWPHKWFIIAPTMAFKYKTVKRIAHQPKIEVDSAPPDLRIRKVSENISIIARSGISCKSIVEVAKSIDSFAQPVMRASACLNFIFVFWFFEPPAYQALSRARQGQ